MHQPLDRLSTRAAVQQQAVFFHMHNTASERGGRTCGNEGAYPCGAPLHGDLIRMRTGHVNGRRGSRVASGQSARGAVPPHGEDAAPRTSAPASECVTQRKRCGQRMLPRLNELHTIAMRLSPSQRPHGVALTASRRPQTCLAHSAPTRQAKRGALTVMGAHAPVGVWGTGQL